MNLLSDDKGKVSMLFVNNKFTHNINCAMGALFSCCGGSGSHDEIENFTPSSDARRQQQLQAAERRRVENEHRGIKNPEKLQRQNRRLEERERRELEAKRTTVGQTKLKWQAD